MTTNPVNPGEFVDAVFIIGVVLGACVLAMFISLGLVALAESRRVRSRPYVRRVERRRPRQYQRWSEPTRSRERHFDYYG